MTDDEYDEQFAAAWAPMGLPETPAGTTHSTRRRTVIAVTAAASVGLAFGAWGVADAVTGGSSSFPSVRSASTATTISATQVAGQVEKSVVDITSVEKYKGEESAGTGMVVTSSGDILTNNHVVDGATQITAKLVSTGKTYTAKVLGTDSTDDVALIKLVGASGLTPITAASGATTGAAVTAIGNALDKPGLPTVTSGAITGTGKDITASDDGSSESLSGLLETNADIVSGDSGGPLVDSNGRVIGMDTAAEASSGQGTFQQSSAITSSGDGYAIPISSALTIAQRIAAHKASATVTIGTPGFLGVEVATTTNGANGGGFGQGGAGGFGYGDNTDYSAASGASIAGVIAGSPAASAGLTQGDTITSVNGTATNSAASLTKTLGATHAGDSITVGWTDPNGQSHTSTVTLGSGPAA